MLSVFDAITEINRRHSAVFQLTKSAGLFSGAKADEQHHRRQTNVQPRVSDVVRYHAEEQTCP